jgi:hypothetical protein
LKIIFNPLYEAFEVLFLKCCQLICEHLRKMDLLNWSLLLGSFALLIKILHEIAKYTIDSSLLIKELGVNLQKKIKIYKSVDVSHMLQDVLYLVNDW